jgi:membrane protein DedA with SNARE-associated domain
MTQFILEAIRQGGYLGIFALMVLENVFPPFPSEAIMGFGGVLVARGELSFVPVLMAGTLGTVVGNLFWYWIGHRWSEAQLRAFIGRWGRWLTFEWQDFERARGFFLKHGEWIVFTMRFSPFLRTIISLPAGLSGMGFWRFCLFTFLGSLIWNTLLLAGGAALSGVVAAYEDVVGIAIIAMFVAGLGYYLWRVITWEPATSTSGED